MKRISIRDRADLHARNAREDMRYCARMYREAFKIGSVSFMIRWLILAANYRDIAKGFLEI